MHSLLLLPMSPLVLLPRPQSWVNYSPSPCLPASAGCQLPQSRLFAGPCIAASWLHGAVTRPVAFIPHQRSDTLCFSHFLFLWMLWAAPGPWCRQLTCTAAPFSPLHPSGSCQPSSCITDSWEGSCPSQWLSSV